MKYLLELAFGDRFEAREDARPTLLEKPMGAVSRCAHAPMRAPGHLGVDAAGRRLVGFWPVEASATTVIVGAFARVEVGSAEETRAALSRLEGVSLFDLDEPGKVGLLLEANDEEGAHRRLMGEIRQARGVLGVWPVYLGSAGTGQE